MSCKYVMHMIMFTCRIQLNGCEEFQQLKLNNKCLIILWHNRLAMIPWLLAHYTPKIPYAALVSNSRDGDLLTKVIHSYVNNTTIRVSPKTRFQALNQVIQHMKETEDCVIITPDGPRGPCYQMKPGIAMIALETQAHIVSLNWTANSYWQLNTWDRLRIPKPFSKIDVNFEIVPQFPLNASLTIQEAKKHLDFLLPTH